MPNQALAFHRVSKHVYDLTGLRTGSVRDQLLRSSLVTHCLADEGLITKSRKLLVFGAGAAGLNAAITAADRGISVDVIEVNQDPFASFRLASWRRVDPVEYDWPHAHYNAGVFPWAGASAGSGIPLIQQSGTGDDLAQDWAAFWKGWKNSCNGVAHRGTVNLLTSTDAQHFKGGIQEAAGNSHVNVTGPWPHGASTQMFGAVLSCVGFGPERTFDEHVPARWGGYIGPSFWLDDDQIGQGNATALGFKEAVISGGGDGGMQDFQRVMTGEFGKELLHKLNAEAGALGIDLAPDAMIRAFLAAEDAGRRAYAWQRTNQPISADMAKWHDAFAGQVRQLFAQLKSTSIADLRQIASSVLRPELLSMQLSMTWVYKDETPGYAYALNRYLSLVVQELASIADPYGMVPKVQVLANHEIVKIRPTHYAHKCVSPQGCFGVEHDVTIEATRTGAKTTINDVDLLVVRHGALPDPLLAGAAVREQMTPFDFPQ